MSQYPSQVLLQRIDRLTDQLNPSVTKADGAQFALMLSMIYQAQQIVGAGSDEQAGAESRPAGRMALYTPEVVGRLGRAVQSGQRGELAMLVSWLEEAPIPAGLGAEVSDEAVSVSPSLAQAALLAKRYTLLDEMEQSARSFAA